MKKPTPTAALDLFGDIPVTLRELELWLFKVPKLPHYARWRESYPRQYNIIDKIKRQKQAGTLGDVFGDECCTFCGQMLAQLEQTAPTPITPEAELTALRRRVAVLELLTMPPIKSPRMAGFSGATRRTA